MSRNIVRKQREWERQDREEIEAAIAALLTHKHGRRFLYSLLERSKAIGQNAFTGNALTTAFQCGEQNIGQQLLADILEVDSAGFVQMLKEMEDERRQRAQWRRDAERRSAGEPDSDDGAEAGADSDGSAEGE